MKYLKKQDIEGIIWAIFACLFVSIMVAIVRKTSETLHVTQILMMRSFFALILLSPIIIYSKGKVFYTKKIKIHFFRSITGFIAMMSWFYVISQIALPEATSITFIVPILTTVAAVVILKERVDKKLWLSLFMSFIGVLVIIRPGFKDITIAHFLSIFSAILWSISNILTKKLSKTDKPQTVVLYISLIIFIFSVPFAIPYLQKMNFEQITWLFFLGLSGNMAHFSLSTAYSKTDLSTLQPFDFSRLIFVSIIAYIAFNEVVDIYMIIGSLTIILGSIYLTSLKRYKKI